jgi:hypothetical protein
MICLNHYGVSHVSFDELNHLIAQLLFQLLFPSKWTSTTSQASHTRYTGLSDLITILSPSQDALKLCTMYFLPQLGPETIEFTTLSWSGQLRNLTQMQKWHHPMEAGLTGLGAQKGLDRAQCARILLLLKGSHLSKDLHSDLKWMRAQCGTRSAPQFQVWSSASNYLTGIDKWTGLIWYRSLLPLIVYCIAWMHISIYHDLLYFYSFSFHGSVN